MAKKSKKAVSASDSNVVRIKASPSGAKKREKAETAVTAEVVATKTPKPKAERKSNAKGWLRPFAAIGDYFKGAWVELRQVRWPNRRATWSLTGAVLLYTAFFVVLVLLLDAGFKYLFELILGK